MATHSATISDRAAPDWQAMAGISIPDATCPDEPEALSAPDGGPYCATCRGARWLKELDYDPRRVTAERHGLVRCPDCLDSQRARRLNRLAAIAGLSDEQRRKTFATISPSARGIGPVVKAAAEWARNPDGWLVIHGAPGSGKTHVSLAAANALIAEERTVVWRYVPQLVFDLRQQVATGQPDSITPQLVDAPILILDDLGAARPTDYVVECLELVFDSRYQRRLPILATLIGTPEDVKARLSMSIGRRMQDFTICRVVHNQAPQWGMK